MSNNLNSKLMAHWNFPNEIWRKFIYYKRSDAEQNKMDLREFLFLIVGFLVVGSIIIGIIGGIMWFLGFLLIAAALFIIHFGGEKVILKLQDYSLKTEIGEIKIFTNNVLANDVIFFWGENGWYIDKIEKDYFPINEQFMMIFRIHCQRRTSRHQAPYYTLLENKKAIIPVPFGKEQDADLIISELSKQIEKS